MGAKKKKKKCLFCGALNHERNTCPNRPTSQCDHEGHKSKHCSLKLLEEFLILEHDIIHNNLHNPKSWVEDYNASLERALTWFHMCAERTRGNYLHLNLIEDLQERVKHLHDVIQKKKFMRKILRAWSTLVEEDELSDGDDHYYHWDGIEMLESMGTKEDLES